MGKPLNVLNINRGEDKRNQEEVEMSMDAESV